MHPLCHHNLYSALTHSAFNAPNDLNTAEEMRLKAGDQIW